uniref:Putative ovule protein n=1 Tax=Solanum chacoense TaxID=4108 RepID=A0A0V0HK63_SOLCH
MRISQIYSDITSINLHSPPQYLWTFVLSPYFMDHFDNMINGCLTSMFGKLDHLLPKCLICSFIQLSAYCIEHPFHSSPHIWTI